MMESEGTISIKSFSGAIVYNKHPFRHQTDSDSLCGAFKVIIRQTYDLS
jgi:hypothetical protein